MKGALRRIAMVFYEVAKHAFSLLTVAWRVVFGTARALRAGGILAYDVAKSRRAMRGGYLHCPRGHVVELEGGVYECSRCGFRYSGSVLLCGNPECGATTSYVDCPDCHLSVRNPYRVGRP